MKNVSFSYKIFTKINSLYFDKINKKDPIKRKVYSRLVKILIELYLNYIECKNFIINCKEFQKGLNILEEYN